MVSVTPTTLHKEVSNALFPFIIVSMNDCKLSERTKFALQMLEDCVALTEKTIEYFSEYEVGKSEEDRVEITNKMLSFLKEIVSESIEDNMFQKKDVI